MASIYLAPPKVEVKHRSRFEVIRRTSFLIVFYAVMDVVYRPSLVLQMGLTYFLLFIFRDFHSRDC